MKKRSTASIQRIQDYFKKCKDSITPKFVKNEWSQEPLLKYYEIYFEKFVGQLIEEEQLILADCFLLARLGIMVEDLLLVQVNQIPQLTKQALQNQILQPLIQTSVLSITTFIQKTETIQIMNYYQLVITNEYTQRNEYDKSIKCILKHQ